MSKQSNAFTHLLRTEHCKAPDARNVLKVEKDLGQGAVSYQLSHRGRHLLFEALDKERREKRAARNG